MPKIQKKKTKSSNVLKFSFTETLNSWLEISCDSFSSNHAMASTACFRSRNSNVRKDRVVIYIVVCGQIKATLRYTADVDLFHVTKFSTYFPFTLHCFYTERSSFMPLLTTGIVWGCFYLLMFYSEKFST